MGFLDGFGVGPDGREVEIPSVILGFLFGPEFLHDLDSFTGLGPAVVEVAAHQLGFFPKPTGADAEDEPAAANPVQNGNLFGQEEGVPFGHQRDTGAQFDGAGHPRRTGQSDVRVGEVGIVFGNRAAGGRKGAVAVDRHGGMFCVPDRLKTQFLGFFGDESGVQGVGR